MGCKLNIKAENGNNSLLFKELAEVVTDPNEAVDIYYYTKTDEFKKAYDNLQEKPKLDRNGEPSYSSFSEAKFMAEKNYVKIEQDSRAKVYKNLISAVPTIQRIIDERIDYLKTIKNKRYRSDIRKLVNTRDILSKKTINESVPRFLMVAKDHLSSLRKSASKALSDPSSDIKTLASINRIAQGYNVIQELNTELLSEEEISDIFQGEALPVTETIGEIQAINGMYIEKSMEYIADEISKRLPHKDRREILNQVKHAQRDQTFIEQVGRYMGDSGDIILAGAAILIKEAEHKVVREGNQVARDLEQVTKRVEAKYSDKQISDELIYQKDNGELHILDINVEHTKGVLPWRDAMYNKVQALKSKPELYDFLVYFSQTYQDMQGMLSDGKAMGTRIPTVLKQDLERMKGKNMQESFTLMADSVKKGLQRSNLDMERGAILDGAGKPVKRVPAFYSQRYDSIDYNDAYDTVYERLISEGVDDIVAMEMAEKEATVIAIKKTSQFISTDLPSTLMSFSAMALNFAAKNEVVPFMESAKDVTSSDKRRYDVVNDGGIKTKGVNQSNELQTKGGETSTAAKILAQAIDVQVYGQKEKDLGYVEILGKKIDYNSVIRKGTSFTGYVQMGMNFMAGIANVGVGMYNNMMEAIGGEYYTVSDYKQGSKFYFKNLGGIMADVGARTPSNIVNLLDEHYSILQGFQINKIKTTERSKFSRLFKANSIFFMSASGEHSVQGRIGMSILAATKTFDKAGNDKGSLLSRHKAVGGELIIDKGIYIKGADGKLMTYNTNQQNRIANRIGAVNRKAHGNYSSKTATMMQADARLAMIAKFRGWAVEGFSKRWGSKKESIILENDIEGFYRTGGRVAKQLTQDLLQLKFQVAKENWSALSTHEKANVRRMIVESSMIVLTGIAASLLGDAGKGVEDKFGSDKFSDRLVLGAYLMTVYQANRLYTEIFAYGNPVETVRLMRSPFATISIIENTLSLMWQAGIAPTEEYETGYRKGQNKALVKLGKLVPLYKQLETLNPDGIKERTKYFN